MTNLDSHLREHLAYYAVGIALADWLTGFQPKAIYSLDCFPQTFGQTISNRAARLRIIETKLEPMAPVDKNSKAQLRVVRPFVLNRACVALSGVAALHLSGLVRKEVAHQLFHLARKDYDRAVAILECVTSGADEAGAVALAVLNAMHAMYQKIELAALIKQMAESLIRYEEISHFFDACPLSIFLEQATHARVEYPETLIKWPKFKGNFMSFGDNQVGQPQNANGAAG